MKAKSRSRKQVPEPVREVPQPIGLVENGDPPKIITQIILPFLVSFLICVLAIAVFVTVMRNSSWFGMRKTAKAPLLKQAEQLYQSANIGDERQELELLSSLYVDPYLLTKLIDAGTGGYTLVDLRDNKSYGREHIKTAISVPFVDMNADTRNLEKALPQIKTQPVIIYSFTTYSQQTVQAALFFLQHGIQTKLLRVGWNEWRHFSNLWIPEPQWQSVQVDAYIEGEGSQPEP